MAVFLARIVMPRSRSSSFESMTRSTTCSLARNVPLCLSMASTSVVFPWSTWAMMAILRMDEGKVGPMENVRSQGFYTTLLCIRELVGRGSERAFLSMVDAWGASQHLKLLRRELPNVNGDRFPRVI